MNIVVLAGGISPERDVSLISGKMIYESLKKSGHRAVLLDVFLGYEGDLETIFTADTDWKAQVGEIGDNAPDLERIKKLRPDWERNFFGPNVLNICQRADAVFMALHGENGENGKIQACFDLMGIIYTGTDYLSSALCMDKGLAKDIFVRYGVPTPAGIRLRKGERDPRAVPLPCVVKTCCGGSSVGVSIVKTWEEYERAKEEAYRYDRETIIEQYIEGREFSVGLLDGRALPVIEIEALAGFYDYKSKYHGESTIETCPARLSEEKTKEMQKLAEKAYWALRLKHYARLDFLMDKDGNLYCLEANTLPGMTPVSLLPKEAEAAGIGYDELCEKLLATSLRESCA